MTVIGLDLSLTAPGWCKASPPFEDGVLYEIKVGTIDVAKSLNGIQRLHHICRRVLELLPDKGAPVFVVVEGFALGVKGSYVFEMGGLGWIIRYALWARQIPYVEIPPTVVKKFATGSGKSQKDVVMRDVYKRWGFEAQTSDEADAYVLGRIGLHLQNIDKREAMTAFQRDILEKLRISQREVLGKVRI